LLVVPGDHKQWKTKGVRIATTTTIRMTTTMVKETTIEVELESLERRLVDAI
jgi:hypothetical protein